MKVHLKLALALTALFALALTLATLTSTPATAVSRCPPLECPDVRLGYTYIGTCANFDDSEPCIGWIYEKHGQTCHVSALSGL